jgi:ADP-ribose pyrophosphatase YjhB (NUDIX family)
MIVWQGRAKHCPLCGAHLIRAEIEGRPRGRCPECPFVLYENPASAAAGLVLDLDRRVLLVQRAIEPFKGHWALPAGYQEMDETPAQTAAREILEESGIEVEVVELFDLLFVTDDYRRPSNLAVFLCRPRGGSLRPGDDALDAAWFDLGALPSRMGFDNGPRILERLRKR